MKSVLTYFCAAALSLGGASSVLAAAWHWSGTAGDGKFTNPGNWVEGSVPGATADDTFISPVGGNPVTVAIDAGEVVDVGLGTAFGSLFAPEWGSTLNIAGALNYKWYIHPVGAIAAPTSTINLTGNGSITGEGVGLGRNWFFNDAPNVEMNLSDNATVHVNFLFWGGKLNIAGGTFTTMFGVDDTDAGLVTDATRHMDISGTGKFVFGNGDQTALVQNWIARGILSANGGAGTINIDLATVPGQTILTAVPEPAMISLAGLGIATLVTRRRRA